MLCFSSNPSNLVGKVSSAEEVDLIFNSETKEQPQISNPSFWKRDRENPQSTVSWISSKAELEISSMKTRLEMRIWESGPKIDPATGVTRWILPEEILSPNLHSASSILQIYHFQLCNPSKLVIFKGQNPSQREQGRSLEWCRHECNSPSRYFAIINRNALCCNKQN